MTTSVTDIGTTPDVGRSDVGRRLDGLSNAVTAARGRIDDEILAPAEQLTHRASARLTLSGEHTIVALAGATGSGKSSLFNSLTDLELAGVGVRRPTTSWALACAWGPDGAQGLLEWMGIPARHQVSRMSMLDRSAEDTKLDGLVLLDLPDHDSTEVSHHLEMDRLVTHADLLVWVLDPQKYADAAIHDRYIRPMAAYSDVTLVVLNQLDRIPFEDRERALADVRRILSDEGLPDVPVIGVSATRGDGVDELKRELASRIRAKSSAKARLTSDIVAAAALIEQAGGTAQPAGVSDVDRRSLQEALVDSAGVSTMVDAIAASTQRRAAVYTRWPVMRLLGRLDTDPLEQLQLGDELSMPALAKTAVPGSGGLQRASAELAIREVSDQAASGLARPWRDAVRDAANAPGEDVVGDLDAAVHATSEGVARPARWWRAVQIVQWLLIVVVAASLAWLVAQGASAVASFDLPDIGSIGPVPTAVVVAVGALGFGALLAAISSFVARGDGRRKAARADDELRTAIEKVTRERVVAPIERELAEYETYRSGVAAALG